MITMMKHIISMFKYQFSIIFLLLTIGAVDAWGQTDYSGTYYIASCRSYNAVTPASNFYLCPTEGWAFYKATNDVQAEDNGQPFLTTYKCKDGVYDATKAVWVVEKDPDSGCYYIKQNETGKYVVSNGVLTGAGNTRARVHLETVADAEALATLGDWALFEITDHTDHFDIKPHSSYGRDGSNINLVVNTNNYNQLNGNSIKTNGPTGFKNCGGIIGLYTYPDDGNAKFWLEISKPVISQDPSTRKISMEHDWSVNIRYTTDGTEPTSSSTLYEGEFLPGIGTSVVKAKAFNNSSGDVASETTSFELTKNAAPSISVDMSTNPKTATISTAVEGGTIYYTTNGSNPTTSSSVYSTPISFTKPTTIKAIVGKEGYAPSTVTTRNVIKVVTPTIYDNGNVAIAITTATVGASIYYTTDGSTPSTESSLYTVPLTGVEGKTIKAIAVKADNFDSDIATFGPVSFSCAQPIIRRTGVDKFTITCSKPQSGVTIYYTTDGSTPSTSGSHAASGEAVSFEPSNLPITVKAIAVADGFINSSEASLTISNDGLSGSGTPEDPYQIALDSDYDIFATKVNTGEEADACFIVTSNINATGAAEITTPFTGTFDGNGNTISNLGHALFNTVSGGTVKNVMLDEVGISGGTNAGAIANEVIGTSSKKASIYNCGVLSGSVGGSGYVGSIVGKLGDSDVNDNCYARVINCFSYATISGGSSVGGIVGYNSFASASNNLRTMVMNCMFYGSITGGSDKAPIYNGQNITNVGTNGLANYNYYFSGCTFTGGIDTYNCALAADERYLTRFEFYRRMLNSNGELAAWYATGSTENRSEMYKWILLPGSYGTEHPFPVLAPQGFYPSVVNFDAENAEDIDANNEHRNEGRKLTNMGGTGTHKGQLAVTIQMGSQGSAPFGAPGGAGIKSGETFPIYLNITDKDFEHFNYNYGKVQLPYYNDYCTGNYTSNRVVTGWKIVSITGGTAGSYSTGDDVTYTDGVLTATPYNFADRKCTNKDLYSQSGRIFSQGAYWDVPEGVTAITIEPYWGKSAFLCDKYWNVVYKADHTASYDVTTMGVHYTNGTDYFIEGTWQKVYNSLDNAVSALSSNASHSVYDYAVVLVGNYHLVKQGASINSGTLPFTVMSADFDNDNEPDYSFILQFTSRQNTAPIRFDFINIPGLGMAQKSFGAQSMPNVGIFKPNGWFEITNTSTILLGQFEYDRNGKVNSPLILHGGIIEQIVSNNDGNSDLVKTQYIHMGSNVWLANFSPGTHQDRQSKTKHVPVSVTGGEYEEFHLTGTYRADANIYDDNAECYIHGGKFGEITGTGLEGIGHPTNHTNGNITWVIDHADITNFFGGGINAAKPSQGNIYTEITNSYVTLFCGGPKFGDMQSGKTVTTKATDCVFGTFYGAGYGGNSYNRFSPTNKTNAVNYDWNIWVNEHYKREYSSASDKNGISTNFAYEFIPMSGGMTTNVARLFVNFLSFSLATTGNVTSTLTDCKVTENFYGGGNLGKVSGNIASTLTNCTIGKNAFGAGFSATLPTVEVMDLGGFTTEPHYDPDGGVYSLGVFPATKTYTWQHAASPSIDKDNQILYTTADLTTLGTVTGNVTLTINGNTVVDEDGKVMTVGESVYGGGEESNVSGNTRVNISGGTITENVFGGGKGEADEFLCSKAMVGVNDEGKCADPASEDNKDKGTIVTISNGTVKGNVYGGGEVGRVEWNTQVKIGVGVGEGPFAPEIKGNVFGGGAGVETHGYGALVRGNSSVTVQGSGKVRGNVYGGGEKATVGRYWVKGILTTLCPDDPNETTVPPAPEGLPDEMPYKTRRGGKCTVVVQGNAHIGPDDEATETAGHVFGAGKGVVPNYIHTGDKTNWSKRMVDYNDSKHTGEPGTTWDYTDDSHQYVWEYFYPEAKYLEFLQTLALVTGTDVTIGGSAAVKGSVYGGSESGYVQDNTDVEVNGGTIGTAGEGGAYYGNVYGGGKGDVEHMGADKKYVAAGLVKGNTNVSISGTPTILHNVYGGGAYGSVGTFTYDGNAMPTALATENTGTCTVTITGGTFGTNGHENGMVFGSSRGDVAVPVGTPAVDPNDRLAWVYSTHVTIGNTEVETTPDIKGSVYGSGENGHTFQNTIVDIKKGTIGITDTGVDGGAAYAYRGNVYGGGCGTDMYDSDGDDTEDTYNPLAGIVLGTTTVNITGGHVVRNVYGAGAMGSVGNSTDANSGKTTVNVTGGRIGYDGNSNNDGNVFGAARGEYGISIAASGLANVRETEVNISYATTPTADNGEKTVQLIAGSVFGGGESGTVKESVAVNMTGGLILKDIYGGGALADTQTSNWDASANEGAGGWAAEKTSASATTTVRATGGRVVEEIYGGALGEAGKPAYVWGDVLVDLNGTTNINGTTHKPETTGTPTPNASGCVVGRVFGCNNINGSPKGDVMVHVYATQNAAATQIANTAEPLVENAKVEGRYDVVAVYGGGNEAAYNPVTPYNGTVGSKTQVIIEGCSRTSIETVYGGGNAAAVPETNVDIKGAYEIHYLFGGGNGKDELSSGAENPGADVGTLDHGETTYGTGNANTLMEGGLIHEAYGGSNQKGIIKGSINQTTNPDDGECDLIVEKIVGAGKYADIDGDVNMTLSCQPENQVQLLFAGADEANVNGNITLNITNGNFAKVFGGNNLGGAIKGKITVNVEETGCRPIKIDNLYLGSNEAAYSVFGYWESDEVHPVTGKNILKPRVSATDSHTPVENPATDATHTFPYAQPELNIISCTYIGNVFGGGLGTGGMMYANPTVNINMEPGLYADDNNVGVPAVMTELSLDASENPDKLGIINNVYGGGEEANIEGNTTVNIATEEGKGAFIMGNVYGGGKGNNNTFECEKALVNGAEGTYVNIGNGLVKGNVYGGGEIGRVEKNAVVTIGTGDGAAVDGTSTPIIQGDVFGGGAGVNTHGYAALVRGNTTVTVQGNAKIGRSVYGGGEIASVGKYKVKKGPNDPEGAPDDVEIGMPYTTYEGGVCTVTVKGYAEIGPDNMQMKKVGGPDDTGYVFGAGKGIMPYENLGVDNTPKRMTFDAGGDYYEEYTEEWYDAHDAPGDEHYDSTRGTDYEGNYLKYIETLALTTTTYVTIGGHAFVKGSVYGGSENGHVQADTYVKIQDHCQIGAGDGETTRYDESAFINPLTTTVTDGYTLKECAHWDYEPPYKPYDKYVDSDDGATTATDGHTFFGNVFGGGSGLYPYKKPDESYEWLRSAGRVYGNTKVEIIGGHILTSVYGGCELTDVGNGVSLETGKGRCIVKMSGGTLGVPRTLAQIAAHPVTCYLFGAGKGDQRTRFNQWTNVGNVFVEINDSIAQPIIYGSIFGGGEDGHVLGNVSILIKTMNGNDPVIGTWGTSYVDGNVFGGGRGFGGGALTAGVVCGDVNVNISGGKMLGSIYGGGRLGSVGTYLVPATHAKYGELIPDGKKVTITDGSIEETSGGGNHGHVTVNISGGTIGNRYEYIIPTTADNDAAGISGDGKDNIDNWTTEDWGKWKSYKHIPYTEFGANRRLSHTKGGNVFAGAMGRLYGLDGSSVLERWIDLGKVKSTKMTVSGGTIKSSVYGGGELGWTSGTHTSTIDSKAYSTEVSMTGGTIGTEVDGSGVTQYTYGSLFGGGYGSAIEMLTDGSSNKTYPKFQAGRVKYSTKVDMSNGKVMASVYGGGELASVGYGFYSYYNDGIEEQLVSASEAANTSVSVSGGTVGKAKENGIYFGGATMGNVYGGGSGNSAIVRCGLVLGNSNVNISGADTKIYHNVYGGGAFGSVGDYEYETRTDDPLYPGIIKVFGIERLHTEGTGTTNVIITGGTIGVDGKDNGMVFGSSRGEVLGEETRDDYMAWINDANVVIGTSGAPTGPTVKGSVYGSGENGHTLHNTDIKIYSGTVGIESGEPVTVNGKTYSGAEYPSRGNVYGGGCGTDTYEKVVSEVTKTFYNPMAGIVKGNTNVTMTGGHVVRAVYGGGSMGSVGTFTLADATYHAAHPEVPVGKPISCAENTGLCTVAISGGKIGPSVMVMPNTYGNVFGAGRGEMHDPTVYANLETSAYFNKTELTISGTAFVRGSVYGGSESGHVLNDTWVKIQGGQIGCGAGQTEPYAESAFIDPLTTPVTDGNALAECPHWPYEDPYAPYDKYAKESGYYDDEKTQSADNARPTGSDGHTFYGNVFGGGSGYEPYAPGLWLSTAGVVEGNTKVDITGGHILTNIYGGNEMTDVGTGIAGVGGKCTVNMSGGTLGVPRTLAQIAAHPVTCYLFGAGKGDQRIFFNKSTNVKDVEVNITGGLIYGSVFGGGEDGHVLKDVEMTIGNDNETGPTIGTWGTSYVDGNVFGGGRGFSGEALTAGNIGGCVDLTIKGGKMLGSIYGGGRLGSVGYGLYLVDEEVDGVKPYGVMRPDNKDDRGNTIEGFKRGYITIDIKGGTIGNDLEYIYSPTTEQKAKMPGTTFDYQNHLLYTKGGNVFAGCMGRLYNLDNATLLPLWKKLGACKQTKLRISGGTIKSSVYGGAELGSLTESATVEITGGTVGTKVTDTEDPTKYYIYGSVFGGGKGSTASVADIEEAGTVGGNVSVSVNKDVADDTKGGIVNKVFGCNDTNGTPLGTVDVKIYKTQHVDATRITNTAEYTTAKVKDRYDIEAVYGGGNLASYIPTLETSKATVTIDGCDRTSINTVYGGGNAASVSASEVVVLGTYEIGTVFGGGNGKDKLPSSGADNPGAHVGYKSDGTTTYGLGTTLVDLQGGLIHEAFGGSNTNGKIWKTAGVSLNEAKDPLTGDPCCPLVLDEVYGAGNEAYMEGGTNIDLVCISELKTLYGGAKNADVDGDIVVNIQSGRFERVFGGNNVGGNINGTIEVNIEETGCHPIVIGQLYGGGNQAAYTAPSGEPGPTVNVRSFTSIGEIYGGGYGAGATVTGDTYVNINACLGEYNNSTSYDSYLNKNITIDEATVFQPGHRLGKIGSINKVFGGGNAAAVVGNTNVNIGTEMGNNIVFNTPEGDTEPERTKAVVGADILDNVFGGGNAAEVTGNTNVTVGR